MKKQTKFQIIGWLLFLVFVALLCFAPKIPFFKEEKRFKYFFLVGSAAFSAFAYASHLDHEEATSRYNYKGFLVNTAYYFFIALLLIGLTIIV